MLTILKVRVRLRLLAILQQKLLLSTQHFGELK
jgi:hypothetical protein